MFLTPGTRAGRKRFSTVRTPGYQITDGAAFAINAGNGPVQYVSLGANRTPVFSGWMDGDSVMLLVKSNGFTLDYASLGVLWEGSHPPRLSKGGVTAILFERYAGVMIGSDPYPTPNELVYVGGIAATGQTSGSTTAISNSLTALTGGVDTTARTGDMVVSFIGMSTLFSENPNIAVSGFTELLDDVQSNSTNIAANLGVFFKFMTATPDTTVPSTLPAAASGSWCHHTHVLRGVDPTNYLEAPFVSNKSGSTGQPDPSSITPLSSNSGVLVCGYSANPGGHNSISHTGGLSNFLGNGTTNTYTNAMGSGFVPQPSGPVDLPAFTIFNDTSGAYICAVMALRALL